MRGVRKYPVAVIALSLVLAACGSNGDDDAESSAAAGGEDPAAPEGEDDGGEEPGGEGDEAEGAGGCDAITATETSEIYAALAELEYDERVACMETRAAEEGSVVLYSSRDSDMLDAWQASFSELYPDVQFEYLSATGEQLYERVLTEDRGGAPTADVIHIGEQLKLLADEGHLATLHGAMIPEEFPDDGHGEWFISFGPSPLFIAWNTDLVSEDEAPQSWEDLLDPKWKGKVAIDTGATHMVKTFVGAWGEEEARDYLDKLVNENDAIIRKGHTNITNMLAAGEFPIAAELFGHKLEQYRTEKEAPIDWVAPDPTPSGSGGYAIADTAPHPYAAALLAHYMAGPEAGKPWSEDGRLHLHPDVEPKYPRVAELIGDPRVYAATPDKGHEELVITQELIEEIIVPAYTGEDD